MKLKTTPSHEGKAEALTSLYSGAIDRIRFSELTSEKTYEIDLSDLQGEFFPCSFQDMQRAITILDGGYSGEELKREPDGVLHAIIAIDRQLKAQGWNGAGYIEQI